MLQALRPGRTNWVPVRSRDGLFHQVPAAIVRQPQRRRPSSIHLFNKSVNQSRVMNTQPRIRHRGHQNRSSFRRHLTMSEVTSTLNSGPTHITRPLAPISSTTRDNLPTTFKTVTNGHLNPTQRSTLTPRLLLRHGRFQRSLYNRNLHQLQSSSFCKQHHAHLMARQIDFHTIPRRSLE